MASINLPNNELQTIVTDETLMSVQSGSQWHDQNDDTGVGDADFGNSQPEDAQLQMDVDDDGVAGDGEENSDDLGEECLSADDNNGMFVGRSSKLQTSSGQASVLSSVGGAAGSDLREERDAASQQNASNSCDIVRPGNVGDVAETSNGDEPAPLGSSQNPIRIIQQGNKYTSMQHLSPEQLSQIMQVIQQQQQMQNKSQSVLFNPQTKTKIVYRIVYPSDIHGASTRKKSSTNQDDTGSETSFNEQKKKKRPRTRSGRLCRPPQYMVKDYKHINPADRVNIQGTASDGEYSDFKESSGAEDEEDAEEGSGMMDDSHSKMSDDSFAASGKRKTFKCETCDKCYIGRGGLSRHYKLKSSHGQMEDLPADTSAAGCATNSNDSFQSSSISSSTPAAATTSTATVSATSFSGIVPASSASAACEQEESGTSAAGADPEDGVTDTSGVAAATPTKRRRGRPPASVQLKAERRMTKLRDLVMQCDSRELMDVVLPRLAPSLSLWKYLSLRADTLSSHIDAASAALGDDSIPDDIDVSFVLDEYAALHRHVRQMCSEQLVPGVSKTVQMVPGAAVDISPVPPVSEDRSPGSSEKMVQSDLAPESSTTESTIDGKLSETTQTSCADANAESSLPSPCHKAVDDGIVKVEKSIDTDSSLADLMKTGETKDDIEKVPEAVLPPMPSVSVVDDSTCPDLQAALNLPSQKSSSDARVLTDSSEPCLESGRIDNSDVALTATEDISSGDNLMRKCEGDDKDAPVAESMDTMSQSSSVMQNNTNLLLVDDLLSELGPNPTSDSDNVRTDDAGVSGKSDTDVMESGADAAMQIAETSDGKISGTPIDVNSDVVTDGVPPETADSAVKTVNDQIEISSSELAQCLGLSVGTPYRIKDPPPPPSPPVVHPVHAEQTQTPVAMNPTSSANPQPEVKRPPTSLPPRKRIRIVPMENEEMARVPSFSGPSKAAQAVCKVEPVSSAAVTSVCTASDVLSMCGLAAKQQNDGLANLASAPVMSSITNGSSKPTPTTKPFGSAIMKAATAPIVVSSLPPRPGFATRPATSAGVPKRGGRRPPKQMMSVLQPNIVKGGTPSAPFHTQSALVSTVKVPITNAVSAVLSAPVVDNMSVASASYIPVIDPPATVSAIDPPVGNVIQVPANSQVLQTEDGLIIVVHPDGTVQIHGHREGQAIPLDAIRALIGMDAVPQEQHVQQQQAFVALDDGSQVVAQSLMDGSVIGLESASGATSEADGMVDTTSQALFDMNGQMLIDQSSMMDAEAGQQQQLAATESLQVLLAYDPATGQTVALDAATGQQLDLDPSQVAALAASLDPAQGLMSADGAQPVDGLCDQYAVAAMGQNL